MPKNNSNKGPSPSDFLESAIAFATTGYLFINHTDKPVPRAVDICIYGASISLGLFIIFFTYRYLPERYKSRLSTFANSWKDYLIPSSIMSMSAAMGTALFIQLFKYFSFITKTGNPVLYTGLQVVVSVAACIAALAHAHKKQTKYAFILAGWMLPWFVFSMILFAIALNLCCIHIN